jgi:hypothetical protein
MATKKEAFTDKNIISIKMAAHTVPQVTEAPSSSAYKYVQFGFNDRSGFEANKWRNLYPQYLIWLLDRSTTHNSILSGKVHYIAAKGFISTSDNIQENILTNELIKHINRYESLNKILPRFVFDLELHNTMMIEVIGDKGRKSWSELYHQDVSFWRMNEDCTEFYYTQDWSSYTPEKNLDWKVLPAYNPNKWQAKSILCYRAYRPGMKVYALPDYIAGCSSIESDYEIANFHLNNLKNGFVGGTIISLNNGTPKALPGQNQEEVERKIKNKFTGTDNTGKVIVVFNDGKENEPTIMHLAPNDLDKQFDILNKSVEQKIFTSHRVTSPILFGVLKGDGLGSNKDEIKNAWELFQNNYISLKQQIVEDVFNDLFEVRGLGRSLHIVKVEPLGLLTDSMVEKVMTVDEIREKAGLPVIKTVTTEPTATDGSVGIEQQMVNDNVKNLTGRQHQQLLRIIRQFNKQQLTKEAATTLLRTSLGLADADITVLLGIKEDSEQFHHLAFNNNELISLFAEYGTPKHNFQSVLSKRIKFNSESELIKFETDVTTIEQKILQIIKKDPLVSYEDIAKALKIVDTNEVSDIVERMIDEELINKTIKADQEAKEITDKGRDKITNPKVTTILAMYDYVKRPEAKGDELLPTSREFCKKIIGLDRYYSRADIQKISDRLGYSVFDFAGGFWNHGGNSNVITPYCRHEWRLNIVRKKDL